MKRAFAMHCVVGASNASFDVLLKNAVIVFAAFRGNLSAQELSLVAGLAWVLFMAPFFIFSAHGGYLGDHFSKRHVALWLRGADLAIAVCSIYAFQVANIGLLLALVFAKGVTATLYSPIKYALVADLLPPAAHGLGYALLEAVSMAAILAATYLGALLGADPESGQLGLLALLIVAVSLAATLTSPRMPAATPALARIGIDPVRPTVRILRLVTQDRRIFSTIVGLSWYWALGAVFLSNVAVLVRDTLHGDEAMIARILVTFTFGVGLGLGAGSGLSRQRWAGALPYAMALLITVMGVALLFSIPMAPAWMLGEFFVIAFASGVYATYFSARLYRSADAQVKSSIFAANNIMSSLFIVLAVVICSVLLQLQVPIAVCLAAFAVATLPVTWLVCGAPER